VPSALPIRGIFAHDNARGIIFPYLCGTDLSEIETPQHRSQIDCFLARLRYPGEEEEEEEEEIAIDGPRTPAVKPGRIIQA
jgi:hypothetical protein